MRIIGGKYRGRKLFPPKNNAIRPTSDKVRQAVFNMLESRGLVQGATVLDAFCGSGALGIEAISRGAKFCTFTDNAKSSIELCNRNAGEICQKEEYRIIRADMTKPLPESVTGSLRVMPPDLILLDPPYDKGMVELFYDNVLKSGVFPNDTILVIETSKTEEPNLPQTTLMTQKIYGDTRIIVLILHM